MSNNSSINPGKGTFARGIHPPGRKALAENAAIEVIPVPARVNIPLHQHIGAPCEPMVKMKDEVTLGDKIGEADAFISAPVHASIAGTVAKGSAVTLPTGMRVQTVPIKAGEDQLSREALYADVFGGEWPVEDIQKYDPAEITAAVREAGIVGLGGAAFPTSVKLTRNEQRPVDTLLLNGCECEPYLTADHRLMVEAAAPVITGALLAAHACGAENIIVAIEDNKPQAVRAMRDAAAGTAVNVVVVKTKYPMGGERQMIPAVLNREVPTGGLPLDVGVVVINVGTAAAVARAIIRNKPLTHRVVSVTGVGIAEPKNLLVPIGISYGELIDFCGGLTSEAVRVVSGGPMMGFAFSDFSLPVTKGTSGITVLTHAEVRQSEETACVRCGRCVDACPLNLVPTKIALASRHADWDLAKQYHIMACMECGCCGYVCPASIPLVQLIRTGKASLPKS